MRPGHCEGCIAENCAGTDTGNYGTLYRLAAAHSLTGSADTLQALQDFLSGKDEERA